MKSILLGSILLLSACGEISGAVTTPHDGEYYGGKPFEREIHQKMRQNSSAQTYTYSYHPPNTFHFICSSMGYGFPENGGTWILCQEWVDRYKAKYTKNPVVVSTFPLSN